MASGTHLFAREEAIKKREEVLLLKEEELQKREQDMKLKQEKLWLLLLFPLSYYALCV
jgi:hypothetical protein